LLAIWLTLEGRPVPILPVFFSVVVLAVVPVALPSLFGGGSA
jgi:hypothetical protein